MFQTVFPAPSIKRQQGALPVTVRISGASSCSLVPKPRLHGKTPVSARRSSWDPRIFGAKTQGSLQMPATLLNHETSWNEKDTDCNRFNMDQTNKIHYFIFYASRSLLTCYSYNPIENKIRIFSMTSLKVYMFP